MPAITQREFEASYERAKQVYEGQKSAEDAIGELVDDYQMNEASANMSISYFQKLIEGKRYGRALSGGHVRYYMENILQDYGIDKLKIFLVGLEKHIEYRLEIDLPVSNLCKMHNDFSEQIGNKPIFESNPPHKRIDDKLPSSQQDHSYWFLGASYEGGNNDQTDKFVREGIWDTDASEEFWNTDKGIKFKELVKKIKPGDFVAIKAAYPAVGNLPFDYSFNGQEQHVSSMDIKAIGVVKENIKGEALKVDWEKFDPQRKWYFTNKAKTVEKVDRKDWRDEELINFTFYNPDGKLQDYDKFLQSDEIQKNLKDAYDRKERKKEKPEQDEEEGNYSSDEIIEDGCFIEESEIKNILGRLEVKKNLILQGPPGTGKTWLAKRLGYALIGKKDSKQVTTVQFHPNMSYEDFVRGFRPTGQEGKSSLELADGHFMEVVEKAQEAKQNNTGEKYVIVIEEINRGNPAQIFGELLTLLEASKRESSESIYLSYKHKEKYDEALTLKDKQSKFHLPVYIPENLYVIGTMNLADRSLALVDIALRRRFAFIGLYSIFDEEFEGSEYGCGKWREEIKKLCEEANPEINEVLDTIESKMKDLNEKIKEDEMLSEQFCIGHSYAMPPDKFYDFETSEHKKWTAESLKNWFSETVKTEILPLLEEYWFDSLTAKDGNENQFKKAKADLENGIEAWNNKQA